MLAIKYTKKTIKLIKHKLNFFVGLFCLFGFIMTIIFHRGVFSIAIEGIFAAGNLLMAFME